MGCALCYPFACLQVCLHGILPSAPMALASPLPTAKEKSFAELEQESRKHKTRRELFLERIKVLERIKDGDADSMG